MTDLRNFRARHIQIAIRRHLEVNHGAVRSRLHRDGRVSAYGRMPNSAEIGWWFAGYDKDIVKQIHAHVALIDAGARA
jgi:hypothetical protein